MKLHLLAAVPALFATGAYAQDANEILKKVQDTYTNLKSGVFQAVRTSDTKLSSTPDARVDTKIDVAVVKPNKVKVDYHYPEARDEWLRVSDGKTFSGFRIATHEKKQSPATANDLDILAGTFIETYKHIADDVQSAKVTGSEQLDLGGTKHDCYIVEVTYKNRPLPDGQTALPTKYWIDKSSNLVLREIDESISKSRTGTNDVKNTRTLSFVVANVNTPVPDTAFAFNPKR